MRKHVSGYKNFNIFCSGAILLLTAFCLLGKRTLCALTVWVFPGIILWGFPPTSKTEISSLSSLFSFGSKERVQDIYPDPDEITFALQNEFMYN